MALFERLHAAGNTIVLVTHHVEEIIPEIRQVVLLDRGRVAASGAPDLLQPTATSTSATSSRLISGSVRVVSSVKFQRSCSKGNATTPFA